MTKRILSKPDNPAFMYYMDQGEDVIACFKVGYYEEVPVNVREAAKRIARALASHSDDITLVRQWDGNVIVYSPNSRLVNPPLTEAMKSDFIKAAEKASGWHCVGGWENSTHGLRGYSVVLRKS